MRGAPRVLLRGCSSGARLEPQSEGGFTVTVPALPEVVTEGDAEEEAIAMAEDAIRLVLAYRRDHGIAIPRYVSLAVRKSSIQRSI